MILEARVAHFTARIEAQLATLDQTITTIPGIGPLFAATILGEIGDISDVSLASPRLMPW